MPIIIKFLYKKLNYFQCFFKMKTLKSKYYKFIYKNIEFNLIFKMANTSTFIFD